MSSGPASNPYRAPLAESESRGPSVWRELALRSLAVGLGLLAAMLALVLVVVIAKLRLDALRFGTLVHAAAVLLCAKGALVLWHRAALTPEEALAEDRAADRAALRALVARQDFAGIPEGDQGRYASKTDRELVATFEGIDPERAGDRYRELVNALRNRASTPVE